MHPRRNPKPPGPDGLHPDREPRGSRRPGRPTCRRRPRPSRGPARTKGRPCGRPFAGAISSGTEISWRGGTSSHLSASAGARVGFRPGGSHGGPASRLPLARRGSPRGRTGLPSGPAPPASRNSMSLKSDHLLSLVIRLKQIRRSGRASAGTVRPEPPARIPPDAGPLDQPPARRRPRGVRRSLRGCRRATRRVAYRRAPRGPPTRAPMTR